LPSGFRRRLGYGPGLHGGLCRFECGTARRDGTGITALCPGEKTRIPNRYYQFQAGNVDFFALDSNTLDAPAPETVDAAEVRRGATDRIAVLEKRAEAVDIALRREQRNRDQQQASLRRQVGMDAARRTELGQQADLVVQTLAGLRASLMAAASGESRTRYR
jgi:hypothetical protein